MVKKTLIVPLEPTLEDESFPVVCPACGEHFNFIITKLSSLFPLKFVNMQKTIDSIAKE